MAGLFGLLVACGGGGGGDRATGVEPGPEAPGGTVPPPPPIIPAPNPSPYAEAEVLLATIISVTLDEDKRPIVEWQLTDDKGTAIIDLGASDVRFTVSKLQGSPLGNMTGTWQSYINDIEEPGSDGAEGPGTELRLQATYERPDGDDPDQLFTNNLDGTYSYHLVLSLSDLYGVDSEDVLAQAEGEGLDLDFDPDLPHRVAMQFGGAPGTANPFYDWVPATGATTGFFTMDIAATANCNRCHDPLMLHGNGRREIQYCVTCHNPGSTDSDSGNTVDMKVMIHKIHAGRTLPSVTEPQNGNYTIWGHRGSEHDYTHLGYPQDIRNCVNCHAGSNTIGDRTDLVQTTNGDNWNEVPSGAACGSCHDDVSDDGFDAPAHIAGRDDADCLGCHSEPGFAGSVQNSHRMLAQEASEDFVAEVLEVNNSMPGETAVVRFKISDAAGVPYDLHSDPEFNSDGVRLAVGVAWDTRDYTNTGGATGSEEDNASSIQTLDIASFTDNGDGSFSATMPLPIPDGNSAPFVQASGSGAAVVEGHPVAEVDGELEEVPLTNAHKFFSIDEADGQPVPRRNALSDGEVVDLGKCLTCHGSLSLHGGNRTDNIDSCVTCHNPRNTDLRVRLKASDEPTDGKKEESLDFKTMIHAIHAAKMRQKPLEVVGYGGYSTHRYTPEEVHYPGNLANCETCHTDESFFVPLLPEVLATTVDTGEDRGDPADDTVVTPVTAVCSSCHDDKENISHMTLQGGSFDTSQEAIDNEEVVESCSTCHSEGKTNDAWASHQKWLD